MPVTKSYLEKIDPQMWITLIGFVFTLGIIYGEFQTMKNQIYIFEEKQKIFDEDFEKAWDLKDKFCAENNLNIPSKAECILCEMIYQMGFAGVSKFKMMIAALQQNNFVEAGRQMLDSRWAKQTPNRAKTLSKQMEEV